MNADSQLDPLRWARFYAGVKHAGQTYSGGLPYTHHLAAVDDVVVRFRQVILRDLSRRMSPAAAEAFFLDLRTGAWLHDVVEDTRKSPQPVKVKDVAEMFGATVAGLVEAMTKGEEGNRAAKAALNYPKLRAVFGATALKLADRIANVAQGGHLVQMYKKEHEDFRRALYTPGEYEELWAHLDSLFDGA
jgi:(p)ppGpp synthase/HD superfamily hydrolase